MNLKKLVGLPVRSACEVTDRDGDVAALNVDLENGESISFTVWTDWSLRVETRPGGSIPDYLWPAEHYVLRNILPKGLPEHVTISRIDELFDEMDTLTGVDIELDDHVIELRSYGGELMVSIT
jgi:hypothetical protein